MARPASQWSYIAILALMGTTLTMADVVKPVRSRKLQMDTHGKPETTSFRASDTAGIATETHGSQLDNIEASASGCGGSRADKGIYGGGQGSGGTSIGFRKVFPFPGLPIGILVPEVDTWGEGGGYGAANKSPGTGTNCQCTHNGFPMHYEITPVYFQPTGSTSQKSMRRDGPDDVAPGPSSN